MHSAAVCNGILKAAVNTSQHVRKWLYLTVARWKLFRTYSVDVVIPQRMTAAAKVKMEPERLRLAHHLKMLLLGSWLRYLSPPRLKQTGESGVRVSVLHMYRKKHDFQSIFNFAGQQKNDSLN